METLLLGVLKKMTRSNLLILTVDCIEQIILLVGLELIRSSLNIHLRGLAIGCAPTLDLLLNLVRVSLGDDFNEGLGATIVKQNTVTAWNDNCIDIPDYDRSHMIHANLLMMSGFGANIGSKKTWNGVNLDGLKITEKEIKKHLRVIKYNDMKPTEYEAPHFDTTNGTYDFNNVNWSFYEDLEKPLIPVKKQAGRKLFIR